MWIWRHRRELSSPTAEIFRSNLVHIYKKCSDDDENWHRNTNVGPQETKITSPKNDSRWRMLIEMKEEENSRFSIVFYYNLWYKMLVEIRKEYWITYSISTFVYIISTFLYIYICVYRHLHLCISYHFCISTFVYTVYTDIYICVYQHQHLCISTFVYTDIYICVYPK